MVVAHNESEDIDPDSAEMRRVGMFSESFAPVQNGVTTSLLTLVAGLRAQHHHVCIFAPAHQGQEEHEINVLRFPSFVSLFNREYPLAYPFLPRLTLATHFDRLRLDIVHTHTPFVLGLTGANLALSSGVPLVSTFHTLYTQYTHYVPLLPEPVKQSLLEHYLPWYYNRCTEIICPSEVAAKHLAAQGIVRPITVIPTGIPLPPDTIREEAVRRANRERFGLPAEAPILLYAGRLAQEKNIAWLFDILAHAHEEVPSARLALAGGGPHESELRAEAETRFGEGVVHFLGPVPHADIAGLFAACDVFCFPSPSETQGLVIGEARAAGLPCVVVDAGGAPETVRDGEDGYRIPLDETELFAARVIEILTKESQRRELSANALKNARHFTPERMVTRALEVYERARSQATAPRTDISPPEWGQEHLAVLEDAAQTDRL